MFTRQKYIVPAAGEFLKIEIKGMAVVIEEMPTYNTPPDVPTFHYDSKSNQGQAMFPYSTYGFNKCKSFKSIWIKGTADSAGDVVWLWINDEYLETDINIVLTSSKTLDPGATFSIPSDDTVKTIPELSLEDNGRMPKVVYVSVAPSAGDGIKWSIKADPAQGDDTKGTVLSPGESLPIDLNGLEWIEGFRWIAQTGGQTPLVNFTPGY